MAAKFFKISSVISTPVGLPVLSSMPITKYPFFLWFGKSLEKAHIASQNLSVLFVDMVFCTLSDSKSDSASTNSILDKILTF